MPVAAQNASPTDAERPLKKARLDVQTSTAIIRPTGDEVAAHRERYASAVPYKYADVGGLVSDELVSEICGSV